MVDVRIRAAEGCGGDPYLIWDTRWQTDAASGDQGGDWALAGPDERDNRGGLRSVAGIASAALLALFSDRRCPEDHPLRYLAGADLRGWWGDAVDVDTASGETGLGSLLWLLERAPATEDIRRWAEVFAYEALLPLHRQGAVARIVCTASLNERKGRIELFAGLYAEDGATLFERRFADLWKQTL